MSEAPEIQKPTIGRTVLIKRRDGAVISNGQKAAPAIVQTAWESGLLINCVAFPDMAAPMNLGSVPHESTGVAEFVWSWPPRV